MSLRGGGAKRDEAETATRNFADEDSFVSMDGREFLTGDDWLARKRELFSRDMGRCNVMLCSKAAAHPHHLKHRSKGGDDSLDNLVSLCAAHHRQAHKEREPRWSKR